MSRILDFPMSRDVSRKIDLPSVQASLPTIQLAPGLIAPASGHFETGVVIDHAGEPIKSLDDIIKVTDYLVSNKRYRDNMLFICGINFGLRVSDLLQLRFGHLIDDDFSFRRTFALLEKKTSSTRKCKKNRYITINESVTRAVILYLQNTPDVRLDDYMFRSESNRGCNNNLPLTRKSVERILKNIASEVGLTMHISTHSLRKTFGYQQMAMSNNDPRKLLLLQKIFGHSSSAITLDYIGLTREEIENAYIDLNLGKRNEYTNNKHSMFGVLREDAV